jgi:hypothetical protein
MGGTAKEDLGTGTTVIDPTDVGVDIVGEEVFVPAWDVHGRVGGMIPSTKMSAHGTHAICAE